MSDPETREGRFSDGYVTVADGLRLYYRDYPGPSSRAPLLCLPGLTRNSRDFADLGERFSPLRRVIALDFRGRGGSDYDPLPARYTPVTYVGDVLRLLDELRVEEAVFVGTSLGGIATMLVAVTAPQRIAAAILNDVGPDLTDAGLERIGSYVGRAQRFSSWDEAANAIEKNNGNAHPTYAHEDWLAMARRVCREDGGAIVFDYDMAIALPLQRQGATPRIDMWPLFIALGKKPLLVIRGGLSDLLSAEALRKMHDALPDMKSATVPDVGHAPMLNEAEAVAAIDDFLASLG